MASALLCIDFINDIVSPDGKLAGKGYLDFVESHQTLKRVSEAQNRFREGGLSVLHVRVGFDPDYLGHPSSSPLFGGAAQFNALKQGDWGTEFAPGVEPDEGELVIWKPRVSAFYGTALESVLRAMNVNRLFVAGVATDLAVQAAARDAHDRDFEVTVLSDACGAANSEDHETSLQVLAKIADVVPVKDVKL